MAMSKTEFVLSVQRGFEPAALGIPFKADQIVLAPDRRHGDDGRPHLLLMAREPWVDMGSPEFVTVTVEPGDRLNEMSDHPVGEKGTR